MYRFILKDMYGKHMYEGDTVKYTFGDYAFVGKLAFFSGLWLGLEKEDGSRFTFTPYGIESNEFELLLSEEYED